MVAVSVRSITGAEIISYLHSPLSMKSCRINVFLKERESKVTVCSRLSSSSSSSSFYSRREEEKM